MSNDLGVPPLAAANRVLVEQRLAEVRDGRGVPETLKIEFRGQPSIIEVIDMPVAQLFYNPGTHRIRAQRSHNPEKDKVLEADPWGEESQDYLHHLLRALPADPDKGDPQFDELKKSLESYTQLEPGLITREGILVNGNTRRAALKDLGKPSIRVGVLPASTTWADIHAVELSLQLRQDHRRDYSYINHLLAVEEQLTLGRSLSDIAHDFHRQLKWIERDAWILAELRDVIRRSTTGPMSLRLMDFEDAKEKLYELHRAVKNEKTKEKADLVKEYRLAAIVLEFAKTDVRFIGADFQARWLEPQLPDRLKPSLATDTPAVSIPGLNRTVQPAGQGVASARALTDNILRLRAVEVAGDKADPNERDRAAKDKEAIWTAFDDAIDNAGKDSRIRKKRQAAPERIHNAVSDLEVCVTDLVMARGSGSLDQEAFDDALIKLREVMGKLAKETEKSIDLPGEGVSWLRAAVVQA